MTRTWNNDELTSEWGESARAQLRGLETDLASATAGAVSASDVAISSDTDASGAGDIIVSSGGVERGRITAGGVYSGALSYFPKIWDAVYGDVTVEARAAINLRIDDGFSSDYTVAFPEFRSRNLPFSIGSVSSFLDQPGKCTTAQMLEMQQAGADICCHSKTHGATPTTHAVFIDEILGSQTTLRAAQLQADAFIQPGSWITGDYLFDSASKIDSTDAGWYFLNNYAAMCGYVNDDASAYLSGVRTVPVIRRYGSPGRAYDLFTLAQAKSEVDGAITYGGAKQLYIHSFNIGTGGGNMSLADFQAFLDYVKLKRDAGIIDLLSCSGLNRAAAGVSRNYLQDGSFAASTSAVPVGWQSQGSGWTIDAGAGAGGTTAGPNNALKANSAGYLWQGIVGKNIRTFRVVSQVKNAVPGTTGTARVTVWQYDGSNVQIGSTYTRTFTCNDAYQTFDAPFGIRPDCDHFYVGLFANSTNYVHYSNTRLKKI